MNVKLLFIVTFFILAAFSPSRAAEVLLVMWHKETDAENHFVDRLKELRKDVTFRRIYANRDKTTLANELRNIDFDKIDLVHSAGTNTTVMLKQFLKGRKPMVFNLVSDPVRSNIIDSIKKPGNNITGVNFLVSLDVQLEIMARLGSVRSMGVWFDPREQHNKILLKQVKKKLDALKITFVPIKVIPDADNFDQLFRQAVEEASRLDANFIIPSYSFYSNFNKIFSRIDPSILTVSSLSSYAKAGATMAIASDLSERSRTLADQADRILGGANAGEIPIDLMTEKNTFLFVNRNRLSATRVRDLEKLGLPVKYVGEQARTE